MAEVLGGMSTAAHNKMAGTECWRGRTMVWYEAGASWARDSGEGHSKAERAMARGDGNVRRVGSEDTLHNFEDENVEVGLAADSSSAV